MSTPESKLEALATAATAEIAKVKSVWASWEIYIVAAASLVIGAIVGHKL